MKRVERSEILDYVTYGEQRGAIRDSALRAKSVRRILVGEYFTFLFENHETVLYQVQEMMRIEHIVKEDDIQHELDTYNELIHPAGTVGCTLLVGIDDEELRDQKLREWMGLNDHIYAKLPNGSLARPTWDPRGKWATHACRRCSTSRSLWVQRRPSPSASKCLGSRPKPSFPMPNGMDCARISPRASDFGRNKKTTPRVVVGGVKGP